MLVLQVDIDFKKLYGIPGGKLRSEDTYVTASSSSKSMFDPVELSCSSEI